MSPRPFARRALLAGLLAAGGAFAAHSSPIVVMNAWTRPVMAAGMTGAGYMIIANRGTIADRLIGASSPAAAKVSIHQSREVGGVMTMRPVPFLAIPARGKASLAPGGFHLMLEGVKRPLKPGDRVPLSLRFARAGAVSAWLDVRVGPPGAMRM
ncbi:MAG: copper chaperone PCu(A)C [Caulobacteraceae bacterium]